MPSGSAPAGLSTPGCGDSSSLGLDLATRGAAEIVDGGGHAGPTLPPRSARRGHDDHPACGASPRSHEPWPIVTLCPATARRRSSGRPTPRHRHRHRHRHRRTVPHRRDEDGRHRTSPSVSSRRPPGPRPGRARTSARAKDAAGNRGHCISHDRRSRGTPSFALGQLPPPSSQNRAEARNPARSRAHPVEPGPLQPIDPAETEAVSGGSGARTSATTRGAAPFHVKHRGGRHPGTIDVRPKPGGRVLAGTAKGGTKQTGHQSTVDLRPKRRPGTNP